MPPVIRFHAGGTFPLNNTLYVTRKADNQLLELCRKREYVSVLAPRQMGKSSLIVRTINRLKNEASTAYIELNELKRKFDDEWYFGIIDIIVSELKLQAEYDAWRQQLVSSGGVFRLSRFFEEVVLTKIAGNIIIFIDEIDSAASHNLKDDLFATVRALYNKRATMDDYERLSFVLVGTATPNDLIRDPDRTPFNIGQSIRLDDFTREEVELLTNGLPEGVERSVIDWIYGWTDGHPYLTMRLCKQVAESVAEEEHTRSRWTKARLSRLVSDLFLDRSKGWDPNLATILKRLTVQKDQTQQDNTRDLPSTQTDEDSPLIEGIVPIVGDVLDTYRKIRTSIRGVPDNEQDAVLAYLKISGVVKPTKMGYLRVRNRIYAAVFNERWLSHHLPTSILRTLQLRRATAAAWMLVPLAFVILAVQLFSAYAEIRQINRDKSEALKALTQARLETAQDQIKLTQLQTDTVKAKTELVSAKSAKDTAIRNARIANATVRTIHSQLATISSKLQTTKTSLTNAQTEKRKADTELANVRIQDASLRSDLETLRPQVASMTKSLSDKQKELSDKQTLLEGIQGNIASLQMDLANLQRDKDAAIMRENAAKMAEDTATRNANTAKQAASIAERKVHGSTATFYSQQSGQEIAALNEGVAGYDRWTEINQSDLPYQSRPDEVLHGILEAKDAVNRSLPLPRGGDFAVYRSDAVTKDIDDNGNTRNIQGLIVTTDNQCAQLWNASTGKPIHKLPHLAMVHTAIFSKDAKRILTASADGSACIWDALTGSLLYEPLQHGKSVLTADFADDDVTVVTMDIDGTAQIWRPDKEGKKYLPSATLKALQKTSDRMVDRSPTSRTRGGSSVHHRDWSSYWMAVLSPPTRKAVIAYFSPRGNHVVIQYDDGTVWLWPWKEKHYPVKLGKAVHLDFNNIARRVPNSIFQYSPAKYVVTTGKDFITRVWDTDTCVIITRVVTETHLIDSVYSPRNHRLITANAMGEIRSYDLERQKSAANAHTLDLVLKPITWFYKRLSPSWAEYESITLALPALPPTAPPFGDTRSEMLYTVPICMRLSPDERQFLAAYPNNVRLWDMSSGNLRETRTLGGEHYQYDVLIYPDISHIVTCGRNQIRLHELIPSTRPVLTTREELEQASEKAFSEAQEILKYQPQDPPK